jgi:hypothetical protein
MPESPANEGFSVSALSNLLGHSRQSLTRWLTDTEPCGTSNGFPVYALADVEQAINRSMERNRIGSPARDRLDNLQCEKLAFQLSVLRKDYISVKEVEEDTTALILEAKRILTQGPASLAPQVVGVSISEAEQLLREWVHESLTRLCSDPLGTARTAAPEPAPRHTVTEVEEANRV